MFSSKLGRELFFFLIFGLYRPRETGDSSSGPKKANCTKPEIWTPDSFRHWSRSSSRGSGQQLNTRGTLLLLLRLNTELRRKPAVQWFEAPWQRGPIPLPDCRAISHTAVHNSFPGCPPVRSRWASPTSQAQRLRLSTPGISKRAWPHAVLMGARGGLCSGSIGTIVFAIVDRGQWRRLVPAGC